MTELWKYIIPAILGIAIGALVVRSCADPEVVRLPGEVVRDTVEVVKFDTVYTLRTVTEYVTPTKPYSPDEDCPEQLRLCDDAWGKLSYENWQLANVVARAETRVPWGTLKAEFSMPRYIEDEDEAFRITATSVRRDSTIIETRWRDRPWYDRLSVGPYIGFGFGQTGTGWSAGLSFQYQFFRPSDIWR